MGKGTGESWRTLDPGTVRRGQSGALRGWSSRDTATMTPTSHGGSGYAACGNVSLVEGTARHYHAVGHGDTATAALAALEKTASGRWWLCEARIRTTWIGSVAAWQCLEVA